MGKAVVMGREKMRLQLACVALIVALGGCSSDNEKIAGGRRAPLKNPGAQNAAVPQAQPSKGATPYDTMSPMPGLLGMLGRSDAPAQSALKAERRRPVENASAAPGIPSGSTTLPPPSEMLMPSPGSASAAPVGAVGSAPLPVAPIIESPLPAAETPKAPIASVDAPRETMIGLPVTAAKPKAEDAGAAKEKEAAYPSLASVPPAPAKALSMKADKPEVNKQLAVMQQEQASALQAKKDYFDQASPPTAAAPSTPLTLPAEKEEAKSLDLMKEISKAPVENPAAAPAIEGTPWAAKAPPAPLPAALPPTAAGRSVPVENQAVVKAQASAKAAPLPDTAYAGGAKFEGAASAAAPVPAVQAAPVKLIPAAPQLAAAPEAPRMAGLREPGVSALQPIGLSPARVERRYQARVLPESRYAARRAMVNARLHQDDLAAGKAAR